MGVHAMMHQAAGYPLPVPWIGVTDTFNSHKEKTVESLTKPFWEGAWTLYDNDHKAVLKVQKEAVILSLYGIEDEGAVDRMRRETCCMWVEEPAPSTTGHGVSSTAWLTGITSQRVPTHAKVALFTSNYPDDDHWTWTRFNPRSDSDYGFTVDHPDRMWFRIPRGDNPYVSDADRQEWESALQERPDLLRRLVEGRPGVVQLGQQVAEGWDEAVHVARDRIRLIEGEAVIVGADFGHTPTLVIGQPWRGKVRVAAALACRHGGMKQHLRDAVIPWIAQNAPWLLHNRSLINGVYDPSGIKGSEGDIEDSGYQQLVDGLGGNWDVGPEAWDGRRGLLLRAMNIHIQAGVPALEVDPVDCRHLIQALNGRWYYPQDRLGNIGRDLPKKPNHPWEDLGDAFIYFLAGILNDTPHNETIRVETAFDVMAPHRDETINVDSKFDVWKV